MSDQEENEDTVHAALITVNNDESSNTTPLNTNDNKNSELNNINDKAEIEHNSDVANDDQVNKESIPTVNVPPAPSRILWKEKPKVIPKANDDIEEFDTDEEEEENEKSVSTEQNYSGQVHYEGNKCVCIEPGTGRKLIWDSKENKWCADEQSHTSEDTVTNSMKNYEFDGKHYVYTDKASNVTYKFIQEKNEWVIKDDKDIETKDGDEKDSVPCQPTSEGIYGFENDTHTYTDPNDGTSYIWDREKNAWFPKVDDDFMARYQLSYGFNDSNISTGKESEQKLPESEDSQNKNKTEKKVENKKRSQEPPSWFEVDDAHNTTIYISNLPLDVTMQEVTELVTKCGLLARDEKGKDKLKLYKDSNGEIKGDARCTYIKIESVELALKILDGWHLRDKTLSVVRAKFQMKGEYDPTLKPKRKKKDKEKQKKIHEKLFDWRPDRMRGEPLKCERVVIIKNLFQPEDFDKDVTLLLEYQQDIRSECMKCGEVKKVTVYDRHPEGVAQVTFKEPEAAQACIQLLNGRWFSQRKISAEIWDGKTKYKIRETEEQIESRINKWDKFLEEQEESEEKAKQDAAASSTKT